MKIYDKDKKKWYEMKRNFIGKLDLVQVSFKIRKFPTEDDVIHSNSEGLKSFKKPREPPTPQ